MISTNEQLPLHDEASGIANLNRPPQRGGGCLLLGIAIGFVIATVLFVGAVIIVLH